MKKPKVIAIIVAAILLLVLIIQNRAQVETHIFFLHMTMPLAVLIVVVAAIAFAAGVITDGQLFRRPKGPPNDKPEK